MGESGSARARQLCALGVVTAGMAVVASLLNRGDQIPENFPNLSQRVTEAFEKAVISPGCISNLRFDAAEQLWILSEIRQFAPRPALDVAIEEGRAGLGPGQPSARLIDATAAVIDVEREFPDAAAIVKAMSSVFTCEPGADVPPGFERFLADGLDGYAAVFQVVATEWARRLGCVMTPRIEELSMIAVDRIAARKSIPVHAARDHPLPSESDDRFTDLALWRLFALALVGKPDRIHPAEISDLIAKQRPDGCWQLETEPIMVEYKGQSFPVAPRMELETPMAAYVLARWRNMTQSANDRSAQF